MATSWKDEALALRERLAKLAEAFGWSQVRGEDGGLNLPPVEDIIERAKQMNLNDYVWVKLTAAGIERYENDPSRKLVAEQMPEYAIPAQSGFMRFQLWDLMSIFGEGLYNGGNAMFEKNTLYFQDPTPATLQLHRPATLQLLKDEGTDASEPD